METDLYFRELCDFIREVMERDHVPGAAVGIIHQGQEYTAGFGVTSVENPLEVDADTLFQIGSTTKTVTGTIAMRLVEMGKLDLDAPVRTYLPTLRLAHEDVAARVTMRHLLTHTAGWVGDYFDDTGRGDDSLSIMVERMAKLEQLTPLGEIWSYSNSSFYLAGRIIEVLTGKTYETAAREMVLDPIGMTQSFFFPEDVMTYRFAAGHDIQEDKAQVARPWALPRAAHAAGGLTCSVKDQMRYARFHLGDGTTEDGTRLLSPESMKHMQSPQAPSALGDSMAITWHLHDVGGVRFVQHGGGTNGQVSTFTMAPARGFALAFPTNAGSGRLIEDVTAWVFERYLGVKEEVPAPLDLPEEELAPYIASYESAMTIVELTPKDGKLIVQLRYKGGFPTPESEPPPPPPPISMAMCEQDQILATDGPLKDARGEFLRGPDGKIAWLRIGGRIHRRVS